MIFIPTTTASRRSLHLRRRVNQLFSLCGLRVRYDTVHHNDSHVCCMCERRAREMIARGQT